MVAGAEVENCFSRECNLQDVTDHHDASSIQDQSPLPPGRSSNSLTSTDGENIFSPQSSGSPCEVFLRFFGKVRRTPPLRILWIITLIAFVTGGNAMQIIGLNFWLRSYPNDGAPGNFTTLVASSLFFGVFFLLLLTVYIIIKRPSLSFVCSARVLRLTLFIALMDAANSYMAIFAASYTPELLQALFTALVPVYAAVFTKCILKDPRNYCNGWVLTSFFLIISGIVVASAYHFVSDFSTHSGGKLWWSLVFFLSVPPAVLMNIGQGLYMIEFTYDPLFAETHLLHQYVNSLRTASDLAADERDSTYSVRSDNSKASSASLPQKADANPNIISEFEHDDIPEVYPHTIPLTEGGDTIVKLVMLASSTTLQFVFIMMTFPMQAVPWWGGSSSLNDAWGNFADGIRCLFSCDRNFLFCMVYSGGFVFTYIGSAYLNQYSVTLCSMFAQLSSPFTVLLLIIVPKWDLEKISTPWYLSLTAVILLCFGSLVYALWEEKTDDEKLYGERKLKEELLARRNRSVFYESSA